MVFGSAPVMAPQDAAAHREMREIYQAPLCAEVFLQVEVCVDLLSGCSQTSIHHTVSLGTKSR